MHRVFLFAVLLFVSVQPIAAHGLQIPSLVVAGLEAYKAKTAEAAVELWMKGSVLASDASATEGAIAGFHRVEQAYGQMIGYDSLLVSPLGRHMKRVYVAILYERGPVYMWFDVYTVAGAGVLTGFLFNTKPDAILPPSFFGH